MGIIKTTMTKERIASFAMNRQIQVLLAFGLITGVGYYMYLQNKKKKAES